MYDKRYDIQSAAGTLQEKNRNKDAREDAFVKHKPAKPQTTFVALRKLMQPFSRSYSAETRAAVHH